MRKHFRNMLRAKADRLGVKASSYVKDKFNAFQIDRVGETKRIINQAHGTHTRDTWKNRVNLAL